MTATVMERLEAHIASIKAGHERVKPGQPERFSDAAVAGDTIAQGDLYLMIYEGPIPQGYVQVKPLKEADKQLVPGNTQGSRHCLDSLEGVTLYRPETWTGEDLLGPMLVVTKERKVLHPTHGPVTIPAGFTVMSGYQPEWDAEQQRQRRNAD